MSHPAPTAPEIPNPPGPDPRHNPSAWIRRWAQQAGDRTALVFEERESSWADFENRVAHLAQAFLDRGLGAGDRIAILLGNHPAYLDAVFAAARIGAIALPINTRLAPAELAYILGDAEPSLALVDEACGPLFDAVPAAVGASCGRLEVPPGLAAWTQALEANGSHHEILAVCPDDPMLLMYSSGTTGAPKGALLPHRKALYNARNAAGCFGIATQDRCLVFAPLFHSLGLHILSLPIVHAGACIVLRHGFDAEWVLDAIARHRASYLGGVPTHYERLLAALESAPNARFDLSSLRFAFGAGAAVEPKTVRAFAAHGVVLKQGYGQTETSMLCCLEEQDALHKAGSVGRPLRHLQLRVITRDSLAGPVGQWRDIVPDHEIGEIVARGPITMLGYWRNEVATRETLREGWVLTGDLARVDEEGFVTLVGRSKEMFISGGENVYPAEIEAAYAKHPAITEIAVKGVADDRWGEVGRAWVVMEPGQICDSQALVDWGSSVLARFKIPRDFIAVGSLPRTGSGKIQKHRLD
ncbi:MAG: long-chain fatty acid--CoA ligase [bacterium]|nr:long-chain fatty acid--CoA ligase [bacterium]